jgi:hypothetical protein
MFNQFQLGKQEMLGWLAAFILIGFAGPWWSFVFLALLAGAVTSNRKARVLLVFAFLAGMAWIIMAVTQDMLAAGRISKRLSGFLSLRFPGMIYVIVFMIASILTLAAATSARLLKLAVYRGENP